MALTIIYIGIISYISSGSFCILEAIKTTKPSRSLSSFWCGEPGANAKQTHLGLLSLR